MPYFSEMLNATNQYAFQEEIEWIRNFAMGVLVTPESPIYNYVMLGAGPGVFALSLAEGNDSIPIEIVDIDTTQWVDTHLRFIKAMNPTLYVIDDSSHRGKTYKGNEIDLLIVDAAHDEVSVYKDIQAWFPHVRIGGHLFFHDYLERENGFNGTGEWKEGGVAAALQRSVDERWEFVCDVGISRVYRKVA